MLRDLFQVFGMCAAATALSFLMIALILGLAFAMLYGFYLLLVSAGVPHVPAAILTAGLLLALVIGGALRRS